MRIGIDARLVTYRRGMGNVVYHLVHALAQLDGDHHYMLYIDDPLAIGHLPAHPRFTPRLLRPALYPLWEQVALPLAARGDRVEVLHCPANTGPMWLSPTVALVLTVHDVMYLLPANQLPTSPSLYQRLGRLYRRLVVPRVARRAAVLTDSEHSRQDILRLIGLPADAVTVAPLAPGTIYGRASSPADLAAARAAYNLEGPFILTLGAIDPRKNTARALEAFAMLRASRADAPLLAVVGLPPAGQAPFAQLAARLGVADAVRFAGFVPEEHLVALYSAAELLLYPSLYEGFGLPVVEAMACDTPVVTSPVGSIPEVAGDAALLVDPGDPGSIAAALQRLLSSPELRRDLVARGRARLGHLSWERAARVTLAAYEQAGAAGRLLAARSQP